MSDAGKDFIDRVRDPLLFPGNGSDGALPFLPEEELRAGLRLYWETAGRILQESSIGLIPVSNAFFSLESNFFSILFLYSYFRSGIPAERRVVYVAINQCMRGMVTGCDNLLDGEYKTTLETDLPPEAMRFRSVLDIMVSDRVLFDILVGLCRENSLSLDRVRQASAASLRALTRSGSEEASEEAGVEERLPPEDLLDRVHRFKTGVLFQCPWAIPDIVEKDRNKMEGPMEEALYRIGMGCQILDDLVDLLDDIRMKRHNYVTSLVCHHLPGRPWEDLLTLASAGPARGAVAGFYGRFPEIPKRACDKAGGFLESGLRGLFTEGHALLVGPALRFIYRRIGVDGILKTD